MARLNDCLVQKRDALKGVAAGAAALEYQPHQIRANVRDPVERTCPILNLLRRPQQITGTIDHQAAEAQRQAAE